MNPLDQRIAELKGYSGFEVRDRIFCYAHPPTDLLRSGTHCLVLKSGHYLNMDCRAGDEFTVYPPEGQEARISDPTAIKIMIGDPWTSSDAKAFELVDELAGEKNVRMAQVLFQLHYYKSHYRLDQTWKWAAQFSVNGMEGIRVLGDGESRTRPEAICRAYIAAMEWFKKQEKSKQ